MRISFGDWSLTDLDDDELHRAQWAFRYGSPTPEQRMMVCAALQDYISIMLHPAMTVNDKLSKFRKLLRAMRKKGETN